MKIHYPIKYLDLVPCPSKTHHSTTCYSHVARMSALHSSLNRIQGTSRKSLNFHQVLNELFSHRINATYDGVKISPTDSFHCGEFILVARSLRIRNDSVIPFDRQKIRPVNTRSSFMRLPQEILDMIERFVNQADECIQPVESEMNPKKFVFYDGRDLDSARLFPISNLSFTCTRFYRHYNTENSFYKINTFYMLGFEDMNYMYSITEPRRHDIRSIIMGWSYLRHWFTRYAFVIVEACPGLRSLTIQLESDFCRYEPGPEDINQLAKLEEIYETFETCKDAIRDLEKLSFELDGKHTELCKKFEKLFEPYTKEPHFMTEEVIDTFEHHRPRALEPELTYRRSCLDAPASRTRLATKIKSLRVYGTFGKVDGRPDYTEDDLEEEVTPRDWREMDIPPKWVAELSPEDRRAVRQLPRVKSHIRKKDYRIDKSYKGKGVDPTYRLRR